MEGFKKITWKEINENAVSLIENWMLVTAGVPGNYNMMTANWGTLGWLWRKPVSTIFVRPHRFTYDFTEHEDYYTLTFFKEEYREVLELMGEVSGRDFDKMNYDGLHPLLTENGSIAFSEAYLIIECKKLFATSLKEEDFVDTKVKSRNYPKKDFHTMYVGEITNIWLRTHQP
jgi:flavin reductase (DIM6/NTAB) family NADH-FMN oxidoreductase RutF